VTLNVLLAGCCVSDTASIFPFGVKGRCLMSAEAIPLPAAAEVPARPESNPPAEPALLLPRATAARLCGVSPATWSRWDAAKRIPAPVRLSPGCVRWRRAELAEWTAAGCPDRQTWMAMQAAQRNGRPR
jgi:predicted DNA-binding transcriptional regulator AlpA